VLVLLGYLSRERSAIWINSCRNLLRRARRLLRILVSSTITMTFSKKLWTGSFSVISVFSIFV